MKSFIGKAMKRKREVRSGVGRDAFIRRGERIGVSKDLENLRMYLRNMNIACSFFPIPEELEECVEYDLPPGIKNYNLKYSYPCIYESLCRSNYVSRMETLVFMEEIYQRDQYLYEGEIFNAYVYYDELDDLYHVIGYPVVEKRRPEILIGGKIVLREFNYYESEGTIVEVYKDGFAFDSKDDINDGIFNIEFLLSRTNTRKQLFSIGKVIQHLGFSFLFPTGKNIKLRQIDNVAEINWFNPALNASQKEGVKNILHGYCRPLPYIIFGPPGTGKTITLVESVCQIATLMEKSVILVATPSNRSADHLTEILSNYLSKIKFLRLASLNYYQKGLVPDNIKQFSMSIMDANEEKIKPYKIIIGTCSTIASLHFHNFPPDYFTHTFVDEAGRCTEPEIMCPISLIDKDSGQVVLFGDPMQLGPTVLNTLCKSRQNNDRLERSFLERLMESNLYQENGNDFDSHLVTRLIYNYRSIPSVLYGYNNLFYENQLEAVKTNDKDIIRMFRLIYNLESDVDHGLFFFDVQGKSLFSNFSSYNNNEAVEVVNCANKLLDNGIKLHQIGIITPYLAQVDAITNIFMQDDTPFIGTIEDAQGLEFDIVLFSSVRTDKFGFIDGKRLNVAISRARYLLLIFGREYFLTKDLDWSSLVEYCKEEQAFLECN